MQIIQSKIAKHKKKKKKKKGKHKDLNGQNSDPVTIQRLKIYFFLFTSQANENIYATFEQKIS